MYVNEKNSYSIYLRSEILSQHLLKLSFPFLLQNPEFAEAVTSHNSSQLSLWLYVIGKTENDEVAGTASVHLSCVF